MRDEAALAAVGVFLSTLRELFPRRCYARRHAARPGQIWIDDHTGTPPYTTARVCVCGEGRSAWIATIRINDPKTFRLSFPYQDRERVRSMTDCKVIKLGKNTALDKIDRAHAREAAEVIRRLVDIGALSLPSIADVDDLSTWRIV